jgi:hypothetical protein
LVKPDVSYKEQVLGTNRVLLIRVPARKINPEFPKRIFNFSRQAILLLQLSSSLLKEVYLDNDVAIPDSALELGWPRESLAFER